MQKNIFGQVEIEDLQSKSGGKFGLNQGKISKLEVLKDEKDGKPYTYVSHEVTIGSREYRNRFFLNNEVYGKDSLLSPGDEGYDEAFYNHYIHVIAVIKHALGALGVTDATINNALQGLDNSKLFEGVEKLVSLAPNNYQNIEVDIFLEYQWNIPDGQDRTFLTLPKNMKGGSFLSPLVQPVGKWKEVRTENGLSYVDDANNVHPFQRNSSYMESNKAIQQSVNAQEVNTGGFSGTGSSSSGYNNSERATSVWE